MLEILVATGLVLAVSTLCGTAIWQLAGLPARNSVAPAVGFAAVLAVASVTISLPGRGVSSAAVVASLALASLAYLRVRRLSAGMSLSAVAIAVAVVLLALVPFAVSGRLGVFGVGSNDDMLLHLLGAWALQGHLPLASSKLVVSGYPIGPHSLAATVAAGTGMSLEHAFTGLIIAVPALLALAAADLLDFGARWVRVALAAGVGLCYLQAARLVTAAFKEPIEALLLVAFVAGIHRLEQQRPRSAANALPLGVLAGGSVYVFGYLGIPWLGATLFVWLFAKGGAAATTSLRSVIAGLRSFGPFLAVGTCAFIVLAAPQASRMVRFASSGFNQEDASALGDLYRSLPAREALGIWPRLDYRFDVPVASAAGILGLVAGVVLVVCVVLSLHRRDFAVPSALIAAAALYGWTDARSSPYSAAKALAILAPLVTLVLARELLRLLPQAPGRRRLRVSFAALLAALLAAAGYSDFEVLRDGAVGPGSHAQQLAALHRIIGRHPTLFLGADAYVNWELRGANIQTPAQGLDTPNVVPVRRAKAPQDPDLYDSARARTTTQVTGAALGFDFDSVSAGVLDRFAFAIVPRSAYASAPPPNWRLVKTTQSYELWRRTGKTLPRKTLTEIDNPGAILDCRTRAGRQVASLRGSAIVRPPPVAGGPGSWRGPVGVAGKSARQVLQLGRGTWAISLQYASTVDVVVTAPGLRAVLPASLEPLGPYWYAGTVNIEKPGRVAIVVTYKSLPVPGKLAGAVGLTRSEPRGVRVLSRVTATRVPFGVQRVPLKRACGRYVDWYRGRSSGSPAAATG